MIQRILLLFVFTIAIILFATAIWLSRVNNHQTDGTMQFAALDAPAKVIRDELGVPYIYAESLDDAFRMQGFVVAQDRLFQLEVVRHLSQGRLAELIGAGGTKADIQMRVMGIPRLGRATAEGLSAEARRTVELYLEGLNTYIEEYSDEHQLGLRVLGVEPQVWTVEDMMIVNAFTNWSSSSNHEAELISQAIIDKIGPELADQISLVSINPDEGTYQTPLPSASEQPLGLVLTEDVWPETAGAIELGSNHWAVSAERSVSGGAMLVNNPHIDSRQLPGIWYPMALITPELRVVGAAGPGTPGFAVARTEDIAYGVTNSYGDAIDLYVETVDPANPNNYLENGVSIPFEVVEDTLLIRMRKSGSFYAEPLTIRYTKRGPVISDHGLTLDESKVISMRWAVVEHPSTELGLPLLMQAKNVAEAGTAIAAVDAPYNYVVVDANGDIAHFTAGRIPNRLRGDGSRPYPVTDGVDNWDGVIPADQMPGSLNPKRGWVGNANHRTLPDDYPYQYSTYFAHSWRYDRMRELLDAPGKTDAVTHWEYMQDVKNMMAVKVVPYMVRALSVHPDTGWVAAELRQWDYMDDTDALAPLLFQAIYRSFAYRVFEDSLGNELATKMLDSQYYWHERLVLMLDDNESEWFDDHNTFTVETRDESIYLAAKDALADLQARMDEKPGKLTWGDVHTVTFSSPVIPGKAAAGLIGGGTFPKEGSGETLNRGKFKLSKAYDASFIDSMRFVADMGDPDKVMAVVSGGNSGRLFDEHLKDQMQLWLTGEPNYWWFSDTAIKQHAQSEMIVSPE